MSLYKMYNDESVDVDFLIVELYLIRVISLDSAFFFDALFRIGSI